MSHSTPHTIYLQDGTLCNLNRRIAKQATPLLSLLETGVSDPRQAQGQRHPLAFILLIVFVALLRNSKDLKDAQLFARLNQASFQTWFGRPLPHGIPDATTISRLLRKLDVEELVTVYLQFLQLLNIPFGDVYSFDGKTMRAVSGEDAVRHMLSLFSHDSRLALGQVGVHGKENEIPAFGRLLAQGTSHGLIAGKLLLGDALHTQKATVRAILKARADYLFVVKGNQKQLFRAVQAELAAAAGEDDPLRSSYSHQTTDRKRSVTTTVTALRAAAGQELVATLTGSDHWDGVRTAGLLRRTGSRTSKSGVVSAVDETIGFISSQPLTAEQAAGILRKHWCIENNLHWVKDVVFREDTHSLRTGNAPQVMSWLRSMCISVCSILKVKSVSDTLHNLEKSTELLGQFLRTAAII